jgi:hypothetical protein
MMAEAHVCLTTKETISAKADWCREREGLQRKARKRNAVQCVLAA